MSKETKNSPVEKEEKKNNNFWSWFAGTFAIVFALLIAFGLWKFSSIFAFLMVYSYVLDAFVDIGMNSHMAKVVTVVLSLALWVILGIFVFGKDKNKKKFAVLCIGCLLIMHALALWFMKTDSLINSQTGVPKYCLVNPITGKLDVFEQPVFDQYGRKAESCNDKHIQQYEKDKHFVVGAVNEVLMDEIKAGFINRVTGEPLFFFCRDSSQKAHLFTGSGYCPWGGGKMSPLNAESMAELKAEGVDSIELRVHKLHSRKVDLKKLFQSKKDEEDKLVNRNRNSNVELTAYKKRKKDNGSEWSFLKILSSDGYGITDIELASDYAKNTGSVNIDFEFLSIKGKNGNINFIVSIRWYHPGLRKGTSKLGCWLSDMFHLKQMAVYERMQFVEKSPLADKFCFSSSGFGLTVENDHGTFNSSINPVSFQLKGKADWLRRPGWWIEFAVIGKDVQEKDFQVNFMVSPYVDNSDLRKKLLEEQAESPPDDLLTN